MRIDVTLWYRLITKGVITPNCYDGNSTISSTMPTSPTPSHYNQYDTQHPDNLRPSESGPFSPTNPPYSHYDDVKLEMMFKKKLNFDLFRMHLLHLHFHLLMFNMFVQRNLIPQLLKWQRMVHQ